MAERNDRTTTRDQMTNLDDEADLDTSRRPTDRDLPAEASTPPAEQGHGGPVPRRIRTDDEPIRRSDR